jgi:immune inhibitor A
MNRVWLALVLAGAVVPVAASAGSLETPASGAAASGRDETSRGHVKPLPEFVKKRENERFAAADLVARGQAPDENGLVRLRNGKYVRYRLQGTEYLTAALVDFTDVRHGALSVPNRAVDNSTYYPSSVAPQHYQDMLFTAGGGSYGMPSMRDFYLQLSSGRFTWTGQVSNWVQIDAPQAEFGANDRKTGAGGDDANGVVYRVVQATLNALAASGNYGGIDLAAADQVDRYDCDGDGVYNEPDGYIDHFGVIHAGMGEEANASADAIWSHRWYANFNQTEGPQGCHLGGYNLPGTGLWVGDYTIMPEDGGVGVFAHEFGHDLGLPDLYNTAAGPDNGVGFWSLMSSGSWASDSANAVGDKPVHMGAWEKLALGWLGDNLAQVSLGQDVVIDLGPAEGASRGRFQALRVDLPNITLTATAYPVDGSDPSYFYSNKGNDLDNTLTRSVSAPVATPISFRANWSIETDWDYAYLDALVGGTWRQVQTSASRTTNPNGQNFGFGITGVSAGWTTVTATLPAGTTAYRFRYWTDSNTVGAGFAVDSIAIGTTVDNATSTSGWTLSGFVQTVNSQYTDSFFHYYLAESRSYTRNDTSLCGAYNSLTSTWLEKQCYADGLLISYRNSSVPDNDITLHPGRGQILPIDAHANPSLRPDGKGVLNSRWQTWDATFGVDTHSVTLSQVLNSGKLVQRTYVAPPVSSFFDSSPTAYYSTALPYNSVMTAGSGLRIDITGVSADRGSYQVHVH